MNKVKVNSNYIVNFKDITLNDINLVGGKNASLGEMINNLTEVGVKVPTGFAITTNVYQDFLIENNLINIIENFNEPKEVRDAILKGEFSKEFIEKLRKHYKKFANIKLAVRSSATTEDLEYASFAGQQDSILNVSGFDNLVLAVKQVFASLFTDRAVSYRAHYGLEHSVAKISVGVQQMVQSDTACSGVMFSLDTESGFNGVIFITASYGVGELIVQGVVNPDEYYVEKRAINNNQAAIINKNLGKKQQRLVNGKKVSVPKKEQEQFCLTDKEILQLAKITLIIEEHYQCPIDIEWAKDAVDNNLYIVQARPETVASKSDVKQIQRYILTDAKNYEILITGSSVGKKIGQGVAKVILDLDNINKFNPGDVLVTDITNPDWEPVIKQAAAIVTNRGGRTCHAAIVARELGIPAVVGCTNATKVITDNQEITVSCAEGDIGKIYQGLLNYKCETVQLNKIPEINTNLMLNIGNPNQAFLNQNLPVAGVGLARLEFIINQMIGIHPQACLEFANLPEKTQKSIANKISGYNNPVDYYLQKLIYGISMLGAAFWPRPVIVRLSDFKTNEYANLLGGELFEGIEENPMLGFRGASRYLSTNFKPCFALECEALRVVRNQHGLTNIQIMIPFVRTVTEAAKVIDLLAANGLQRDNDDNLKIIMMCEIPSNVLQAEQFLQYFDGFSIGSNDLTQLTLGIDRDSDLVANLFNEQDPAMMVLLQQVIATCQRLGKYVGICGQGPSDNLEFAKWLMEHNIDSISITPDAVLPILINIAG